MFGLWPSSRYTFKYYCIAILWDEDIMCITAAVMCIVVTIVPVLEQRSHSANIINVPSIWRPPLIWRHGRAHTIFTYIRHATNIFIVLRTFTSLHIFAYCLEKTETTHFGLWWFIMQHCRFLEWWCRLLNQ